MTWSRVDCSPAMPVERVRRSRRLVHLTEDEAVLSMTAHGVHARRIRGARLRHRHERGGAGEGSRLVIV